MLFPEYIKTTSGYSCLRRTSCSDSSATYKRDAGAWSMRVDYKDGVLVGSPNKTEVSWVECTETEWRKDNEGYV